MRATGGRRSAAATNRSSRSRSSESQLPGAVDVSDDNPELLIALDAALRSLEQVNERQSRIVECRFFGGLTIEETAAALGISTASVSRGWALAQVRLFRDVQRELAG